jgi:chromosomal replication initiation ATPase DnaA
MKSKRGTSNEPRNVAIYLTRTLRRDNLPAIGSVFGMHGYSSVSSAIERIGKRLPIDKELQNRINEIKLKIIYSKSQTET